MCKWNTCEIVRLHTPREISGRTEVAVDSCIASIVQAINDGGMDTIGSCCGHGKSIGSILLADGRELLIKYPLFSCTIFDDEGYLISRKTEVDQALKQSNKEV